MPADPGPSVVIRRASDDPVLTRQARDLSNELGLPLDPQGGNASTTADLVLEVTAQGLQLREAGKGRSGAVRVDFGCGSRAMRQAGRSKRRDLLARAIGLTGGAGLLVLDATAGLCSDAFQMARWGCKVLAVERNAVMFALVRDGIQRALQSTRGTQADADGADSSARTHSSGGVVVADALSRIQLIHADALHVMRTWEGPPPDVVYIDPMFPATGRTARAKKQMALGRRLVGADPDASRLLEPARKLATKRVVVKRSRRDPSLDGKPDIIYRGTTIRYDVYLIMSNRNASL